MQTVDLDLEKYDGVRENEHSALLYKADGLRPDGYVHAGVLHKFVVKNKNGVNYNTLPKLQQPYPKAKLSTPWSVIKENYPTLSRKVIELRDLQKKKINEILKLPEILADPEYIKAENDAKTNRDDIKPKVRAFKKLNPAAHQAYRNYRKARSDLNMAMEKATETEVNKKFDIEAFNEFSSQMKKDVRQLSEDLLGRFDRGLLAVWTSTEHVEKPQVPKRAKQTRASSDSEDDSGDESD